MESKIDVNLKWRFLKNRALAAAGARFFIICASKLRRKIDRKSITKPSTRWNAPWHRLSFDFGRFRSASSGGKTIQNRCRKTSKIVMLLARGRLRPGSKGVFPLPSSGNTIEKYSPSSRLGWRGKSFNNLFIQVRTKSPIKNGVKNEMRLIGTWLPKWNQDR